MTLAAKPPLTRQGLWFVVVISLIVGLSIGWIVWYEKTKLSTMINVALNYSLAC